jgi:hypothetical protein
LVSDVLNFTRNCPQEKVFEISQEATKMSLGILGKTGKFIERRENTDIKFSDPHYPGLGIASKLGRRISGR